MRQERSENLSPEQTAKIIGGIIESNVLDVQESKIPVREEIRQLARRNLEQSGVDVHKLSGESKSDEVVFGGVYLREAEYKNTSVGAAALVIGTLGEERTRVLIDKTFEVIWESKDRPKADSQEEMMEFVNEVVGQMKTGEFKLDIAKLSGGVEWKKTALYRLEAVMHVTYKLLRIVSIASEDGAKKYQQDRLGKFRQRIVKGHIRDIGREMAAPQVLAMEEKEIVRHLNPGMVGVILEALMQKTT